MFDKSTQEMREELEILHGNEVYKWSDNDIIEEYTELTSVEEGDFRNIDDVDDELNERYKNWNEGVL